ncbi:MAG: outer membrane protein [Devosia sp.]
MKAALILGALAASAGAASAADLIVDPIQYTEPMMAPAFDWSGFYAGVHAGYGWGTQTDDQSDLFPGGTPAPSPTITIFAADEFDVDGFIGGVHAGFNAQMDQFVLGVEGDVDWTGIGGGMDATYPDGDGGEALRSLSLDSLWQASLRARAGLVVDERTLFYATGGIAFAQAELTVEDISETPGDPSSSSDTAMHTGWTVGLGAEHAFTDTVLGRAELRYTDFGLQTYDTIDGPVESEWNQLTATVGVSFKF